jgi:hypothetical protein
MKTHTPAAMAVLLVSSSAWAQSNPVPPPPPGYVIQYVPAPAAGEPPVFIQPPDRIPPELLEKHVEWAIGAGPAATVYSANDVSVVVPHVHVNLMIGHEVWKSPLSPTNILSVGIAYMGSMEVNDTELLHRHGVGVMFRQRYLYASISAGITFLHDFPSATMYTGGHFGGDMGVRIGPVQLGLPIVLDVVPIDGVTVVGTTFAITLGVQL